MVVEPKSNILYLRVISIADESLAKKPEPSFFINYLKPTYLVHQWNIKTCFLIKGPNMKKLTLIEEKVMHAGRINCMFFFLTNVTCMH
jgi:hypothetical protein